MEGTGWKAGTDLGYLRVLAAYWQDGYDWRKQEAELNRFAHFKTMADNIGIHFIHERGQGPHPFPLIRPPREWAERFFNVERWTEMPRGHFAAMEEPELLARQFRETVKRGA